MKKTIFVIGTGPGLGNGVAEKFASCGFKVVLFSRSQSHLDEYAADFVQKGFDIGLQVADVTDFTSFAKSFQNAININGFPDVLFYNVGITAPDNKETMNSQVLMEHYAAFLIRPKCIRISKMKNLSAKH